MKPRLLLNTIGCTILLVALASHAHAATTDLATKPLTPMSVVHPNLMFILDDSGSMAWTYMPDTAANFDTNYGYASSQCNGVYYNPRIVYSLPVDSTGASYPAPNFNNAWDDGYNTGAGSTDLRSHFRPSSSYSSEAAYYYQYNGSQTSSDPQTRSRLQNYYDTSSTFYTECNSAVGTGAYTATITVGGSGSTSVSSIKVNGVEIMSGASSSSTSTSTVANNIDSKISLNGYSATHSGSIVTITGPASSNGYTPVITQSGGMTLTPTIFSNPAPFTKVVVSATSGDTANGMPADERQNFANWYSYYRTRMNMMKSATGIAFQAISSGVRVSFMSLNETGSSHNLVFADFDAAQKSSWYSKLYGAVASGSTPLRVALSNAGRLYTNKVTSVQGITWADPVQYSCQKNFTLLSTDGFWNGSAGYKENGTTAVGNTDGIEPRPQNDGAATVYTKTTTQLQKTETQTIKSTSQIQQTTTAYQTRTSNLQKQTSQLQRCTKTLQKSTGTLQQREYSSGSWSSWHNLYANYATLTINSASSASISDNLSVGGSRIVYDKTGSTFGNTSNTSTLAGYIAWEINRCTTFRSGSCDVSGYYAVANGNVVTIYGPASVGATLSWSMDNGSASITKTSFQAGAASCTWSATNQCQYSWGAYSNVASCSVSYSTDTTDGTTWSGSGTNCQYSACSGTTGVSSCTNTSEAGPNYTVASVYSCSTVVTSAYADTTADCTVTTVPDGSGYTTQCQYAAWSAWSNVTANRYATVTISAASNAVIKDDFSVSGSKIVRNKTNNGSSTSSASSLANYLATEINACTSFRTGSCDVSGYSAVVSGTGPYVVTIYGPSSSSPSIGATMSWSMDNGSMTSTKTAFAAGTASCTAAAQSGGSPYTVHPARECATNATTVGVASCTPSANVTCATVNTGPTDVSSCTNASASSMNNYTTTTCGTRVTVTGMAPGTCVESTTPGKTVRCATSTTTATVSSCVPESPTSSNQYKTITCSAPSTTGGTSDTLADVAEYYYANDLRTSTLGNCTSGSSGNTLCAAGEIKTDTKSYNNVKGSSDIDKANWQHMTTFTLGLGARGAMAYGESNYLSDSSGDFYSVRTGATADSTQNPPVCSWQADGTICNWPIPASDSKNNIDDLWHAAVNGRGTYYSATDPAKLATSLKEAIDAIMGVDHSLTAPTLSNPIISAGDNYMFASTFDTNGWYSDLARRRINPDTGALVVDADGNAIEDWNAQGKLDSKLWSSRTIYTYDSTNANGNKLKLFTYANLTGAEQNYFTENNISSSPPSGTTGLSQFIGGTTGVTVLTTTNKDTSHAAGANLVNYLRGDRTWEGKPNDNTKYYRMRPHILGDIANSQSAYVKAPLLNYPDPGYGAYKAVQNARQSMVYVGANDGMLHAFYAYGGNGSADADPVQYMDTATGSIVGAAGAGIVQVTGGDEAWTYIPSMLLPKLFTLADKNYDNKHQFFVDGSPTVGDICVSSCTSNTNAVWKTILVGGLNNGGKGYYALDITNPAAPQALWEFTTSTAGGTNLGYTYGKPVIAKLKNGRWVVLVTSGYNNVAAGQDGKGHLYVLDAYYGLDPTTHLPILDISTGAGDATTPSGLAQITAAAAKASSKENTITQVYGGDLLGNVWRFDVNGDVGAAGNDAQLLASLKNGASIVQPVTTKPEVGIIDNTVMVYVGTGKYLGNNNGVTPYGDAGNTVQQSMYAIKDPLTGTALPASTPIYTDLRTSGIAQTVTSTTCPGGSPASICTSGQEVRTSTSNTVDLSTKSGWYIDFPGSGERVNTDPLLWAGTLAFTTNVPQTTACSDGKSYIYFVDYRTGAPILPTDAPANTVISVSNGDANSSGPVGFQLAGSGDSFLTVGTSDGKVTGEGKVTDPNANCKDTGGCRGFQTNAPPAASARRTSWRELMNEQ